MRLFRAPDEQIDTLQELLARGVGAVQDQFLGARRKQLMFCRSGPTTKVAVNQQGEPAEIFSPPRVPEVTQDVFETESPAC